MNGFLACQDWKNGCKNDIFTHKMRAGFQLGYQIPHSGCVIHSAVFFFCHACTKQGGFPSHPPTQPFASRHVSSFKGHSPVLQCASLLYMCRILHRISACTKKCWLFSRWVWLGQKNPCFPIDEYGDLSVLFFF